MVGVIKPAEDRSDDKQLATGLSPDELASVLLEIQGGNSDAFEQIVDRYHSQVFWAVRRLVPSPAVDEVAHSAFLRIFQALPRYKEKGKFEAWLKRIAVHSAYDYWREVRRHREDPWTPEELSTFFESDLNGSADIDSVGRVEERQLALKALNLLEPDDRMLFVLLYLEEWSVAEVAESLGWSQANTKVRAFRAKRMLRKKLESEI